MLSSLLSFVCAAAFYLTAVQAAPAAELDTRAGVTALSSAELASYTPYTQFARAAYCPTSVLNGWKCGEACKALPGFVPTLVGGDGGSVPIYFVGWWPAQNTIVVAHEGTDPTELEADLTDINLFLFDLNKSLFPGIPAAAQVHVGFRDAHASTASIILKEVKRLMAEKGTTSITTVGHSLGGALAELDALFLTLNIPTASVKAVTYGTPRVGNPEFVAFFDTKVTNFKRINNEYDLIPILPGRFLGFSHPKGEVHILSPGKAVSCPGNDDAVDAQCTISSVPNIFSGNIIDHLGPYEGIYIGTIFCT